MRLSQEDRNEACGVANAISDILDIERAITTVHATIKAVAEETNGPVAS